MKKTILLSMYNFKGGVGKTTATYNIGYILSKLGLKVLLVDADPQSNLTGLIMADLMQQHSEKVNNGELDESKLDPLEELYFKAKQINEKDGKITTIRELLVPLVNEQPKNLDVAKKVELSKVKKYDNLYYLPGHVSLSDVESSVALGVTGGLTFYTNIPGYITNIFREIGNLNSIDIIIFDLNPSSSIFNGAVMTGSDYFIVPFSADYFSYQAIYSLSDQITSWHDKIHLADKARSESKIGLINSTPKFLGAFPQKVRFLGTEVIRAYANWTKKIYDEVEKLGDSFDGKNMVSDNYKFKKVIGIVDFISAGLDVQFSGRPMSDTNYIHTTKNLTKNKKGTSLDIKSKAKQNDCYNGYVSIITEFFKNLSSDDLNNLNDNFKRNLLLDSNITIDVNASYQDRPQTPVYFPIDEIEIKKDNLWYTNEDIDSLLTYYISSTKGCFAIKAGPGFEEHMKWAFQQANEQLQKFDFDELKTFQLMLPINISTSNSNKKNDYSSLNHWSILIFNCKSKDIKKAEIIYMDPLGKACNNNIVQIINEFFNNDFDVNSRHAGVYQEDGFNCGPWIVEFGRSLAQCTSLPQPGTNEINERRTEHQSILKSIQLKENNKIINNSEDINDNNIETKISSEISNFLIKNNFISKNNKPKRKLDDFIEDSKEDDKLKKKKY
jgi:chromosome partitioning protein